MNPQPKYPGVEGHMYSDLPYTETELCTSDLVEQSETFWLDPTTSDESGPVQDANFLRFIEVQSPIPSAPKPLFFGTLDPNQLSDHNTHAEIDAARHRTPNLPICGVLDPNELSHQRTHIEADAARPSTPNSSILDSKDSSSHQAYTKVNGIPPPESSLPVQSASGSMKDKECSNQHDARVESNGTQSPDQPRFYVGIVSESRKDQGTQTDDDKLESVKSQGTQTDNQNLKYQSTPAVHPTRETPLTTAEHQEEEETTSSPCGSPINTIGTNAGTGGSRSVSEEQQHNQQTTHNCSEPSCPSSAKIEVYQSAGERSTIDATRDEQPEEENHTEASITSFDTNADIEDSQLQRESSNIDTVEDTTDLHVAGDEQLSTSTSATGTDTAFRREFSVISIPDSDDDGPPAEVKRPRIVIDISGDHKPRPNDTKMQSHSLNKSKKRKATAEIRGHMQWSLPEIIHGIHFCAIT
ncbi:hypothetical protein BJX65DRAFT_315108 [Aspergillus insuetus]